MISRSEYYQASLKVRSLNKEKIFLIGLTLKFLFILFLNPYISSDLFIPFLKNTVENFSFNPWNNYLLLEGRIDSFPYGLIMLIAYLPLSFFGNILDQHFYDLNFLEFGFKLTSLFFDYLLLVFLFLITDYKNKNLLLICYWISPITIYTIYIHGQLDIVPVSLLICSVYFIKLNKFRISGFIFALSLSSKFSMFIGLPFILIYIYKRKGFQEEISCYIKTFILSSLIFYIPYISSYGFIKMVFGTKELNRLYSVFIDYGSYLKLYVVPVIYLFSLYLFWRLSRITQDLFLVSLGIGFLSILVFLPPATGWFFWVIPFLTYYQITSKKDFILISFIYNLVYVINTMLYENFLNLQSSPIYIYLFSSDNSRILSIFFTLQQSLGLLIAIRMYIYGLKRNNFYSTDNNTILISVEGNHLENTSVFLNALNKLIYKKDITFSFINSIIAPFPLVKKARDSELESNNIQNIKKNEDKIIYYPNYISENISKVEKNLFENKKPFHLLVNDSKLDLNLLIQKIDIKLELNNFNKEILNKLLYEDIKKNYLRFDFKNINAQKKLIKSQYSLVTYFPLGILHTKLFELFISVSSLKVDIELINKKIVKMEIEGDPNKEDISQIAQNLIPEIDDLSLNENGWAEGYCGIIQIIFIANLANILKSKK